MQLINANNDEHIWAEDYDRDLTDVFAIQTDLAQKIASALQAKLSPNEKARLDHRPTQNPDAYLLFVQAHDYASRKDMLRDTFLKAEPLFEQAIKLDPNFAAAFAGLSLVESWIYHSFDPTPGRREKARRNADEALAIATGSSRKAISRSGSVIIMATAITSAPWPNSKSPNANCRTKSEAYLAIGAIQRRQGKWAESNANLEKAATLDPKNINVLTNLGFSYMALRDFEAADKIFDRLVAAAPQSLQAALFKGGVAVLWKGDLSVVEKQFLRFRRKSTRVG